VPARRGYFPLSDWHSCMAPPTRLELDRHQAFLGFLKHLPEWLSLQQAAIVYGVSVDVRRRNRAQRGSRIGGRLIRVRVRGRVRVDDLDRSSGRSRRYVHRFVS